MTRNLRLVAGLAAGLLLLAAPAHAAKFSTSCGAAKIPQTDRNGAICLGICGSGPAIVGCHAARTDGLILETGASESLVGAERVWITILGKEVTLGQLADELRRRTGWKVVVPKGFGRLELRAGRWKGDWTKLDRIHWKIATTGTVQLSADETSRTFRFSIRA